MDGCGGVGVQGIGACGWMGPSVRLDGGDCGADTAIPPFAKIAKDGHPAGDHQRFSLLALRERGG